MNVSLICRDLKPENVLLDKGGHIKVSDFGVASLGLFGKDRMNTFYGSSDYVAPEVSKYYCFIS
jgi:serine/threonine protein kinase